MLDIFGNVFGRSKKTNGGQGSPSTSRASGLNEQESPDNQLPTGAEGHGSDGRPHSEGIGNASSSLYPADLILNDNMFNPSSSQVNTWNSHVMPGQQRLQRSLSNPVDSVPFARSGSAVTSQQVNIELGKYFQIIERIGVFLSTPSQSDYSFKLEQSVLEESLSS